MLKHTITIFLLFCFTVQTFHRAFIVFDFYRNQEWIARTQCENRYRPMLHCNGTCQLAKKLKQEEKKDQDNPERKMENKNEFFYSRSTDPVLAISISTIHTAFTNSNSGTPVDYVEDFFHPPGA